MQQSVPPSQEEILFYYRGFRRVLRRYRVMTVAGWAVVVFGFVSLLLGWNEGLPHGLVDFLLAVATFAAGLFVVQQAVTALQEYLSVPFPEGETVHPAVREIRVLMEDMRKGGWREARKGIMELERIARQHQFGDDRAEPSVFSEQ